MTKLVSSFPHVFHIVANHGETCLADEKPKIHFSEFLSSTRGLSSGFWDNEKNFDPSNLAL